jgi:diguanylate cyclase (GGDEF)-like protein/PAS domain S-box-containing protein
LIATLTGIAFLVFAVTSALIYLSALERAHEYLKDIASIRAAFAGAVLDFDREESADFPGGGRAATLSQLRDARESMPGFGETGELLIAEKTAANVKFVVPTRFQESAEPLEVASGSEMARPVLRALTGERGSLIVRDYRGKRVIAGYAPVEGYPLAVVAKMDLADIRAPFLTTAAFVGVFIALLVIVGAWFFTKVTRPVQRKLATNEGRFEAAQRIARMGSWTLDLATERFTLSADVRGIFGLSGDVADFSLSRLIELVNPVDRHRVRSAIDSVILTPEAGCFAEFRALTADGNERNLQLLGVAESDATASPSQVFGVFIDITERKSYQRTLTILDQALQSINEAVLVIDRRGRVVNCNNAYEAITGYSSDSIVGKRLRFGRCNMNSRAKKRGIAAALRNTGAWSGELWDRKKQGDYYPADVSITSLCDDSGITTHLVAVIRDVSREKSEQARLEQLAFYDWLTGVPNREKITAMLQERIEAGSAKPSRIGVCIIDLDSLKLVNTSLGHETGDEVIKAFASRAGQQQGASDAFGRLGGDQFLLLLNECPESTDLSRILDELLEEFHLPYQIGTSELFVGVSIGVALYPEDGADAATLIAGAELALEHFRINDKRGYLFYSAGMRKMAEQRQDLETRMNEGLARDEFRTFYQPKVELRSGHIVGAEALVRWIQSDEKLVSPAEFVPIAEASGLILPLGRRVMEQAFKIAETANAAGEGRIKIAINLSPRQFVEKDLAEKAGSLMAAAGVSPDLIEFEVTETAAMMGVQKEMRILTDLQRLGCSIAMDDFGTGYSSLSYLRKLPVDTLKIDRSFITGVTTRDSDAEMVRAIVSMARTLGLTVVAEGVETLEQLEFLKRVGCDVVQGFLIAKPMSEEDFLNFVASYKGLP